MKDQDAKMFEYTSWLTKHGGFAKDMTMRDHFAGLAMQALLTEIEPGKEQQILLVPQLAYSLSDEMLKARDK